MRTEKVDTGTSLSLSSVEGEKARVEARVCVYVSSGNSIAIGVRVLYYYKKEQPCKLLYDMLVQLIQY